MLRLTIKSEKPFVEKKVVSKNTKDTILVGVKVFPEKELKQVRKEFAVANHSKELEAAQKALELLKESGSETEIEDFETEIETLIDQQAEDLKKFYSQNVVYLKNISLEFEDSEGKKKDLQITDTRDAKPVESLWETPEECLAVLLDLYLESASFRDSLRQAILSGVFGVDFKGQELKN